MKSNTNSSSKQHQHSHWSCLTLSNSFDTDKLNSTTISMNHPAVTETVGRRVIVRETAKKLTRSCLVFLGEHGLQELFHIEEDFEDAIVDLELKEEQIDQKWQMVLAHRPRQKWNSMWNNNRLEIQRTNKEQWKEALLAFRKLYAPSKRARDEVIEYLYSDATRKPLTSSCQAHADRVETCCARANLLHGIRQPLSEREIK